MGGGRGHGTCGEDDKGRRLARRGRRAQHADVLEGDGRRWCGNALESYDFAVYGFLTPVIAVAFFPSKNVFVGILSAFAVFAVGFGMRPLGAIVFGILATGAGDGRR